MRMTMKVALIAAGLAGVTGAAHAAAVPAQKTLGLTADSAIVHVQMSPRERMMQRRMMKRRMMKRRMMRRM